MAVNPIPLSAPFGGIDQTTPIQGLESPFCESLLNFNTTSGGVTLRNGDSVFAKLPAGTSGSKLYAYGDTKLLQAVYNSGTNKVDIYDVEAGTVGFSTGAAGNDTTFYSVYFNKYLFLFNPGVYSLGVSYNGSAYAAINFTAAVGPTVLPRGGGVFNERIYIIQSAEAGYWYGEIDAISGAIHYVDLSSIVENNCFLVTIAPITIADNVSAVTLLAFIFSNGEVLFYSGAYPDSADWQRVGHAKISQPLNYNSSIRYQGDALVMCDNGVVSLRDLFLKGSEDAASLTVNSRIQTTWALFVKFLRASASVTSGPVGAGTGVGAWDSKNNRIIIVFPYTLVSTTSVSSSGSHYFVFDTIRKSWNFHRSFGIESGTHTGTKSLVFYKNKILVSADGNTPTVWEKEGATGFTDRSVHDDAEIGFDYEIKSAPIRTSNDAYVKKCQGLDLFLETDLHAQTNYALIRDLGVETTAAQQLPSDSPTTLQKPNVNIGIEGSYLQYKISGTTAASKTVGLKLYGVTAWMEPGSSPR